MANDKRLDYHSGRGALAFLPGAGLFSSRRSTDRTQPSRRFHQPSTDLRRHLAVLFIRENFELFHAIGLFFVMGGIWLAERGKDD